MSDVWRGAGYPPTLRKLAEKYKVYKKVEYTFSWFFHRILFLQICRKCGATNPIGATNCRKRACGHSTDLRDRHGMYMKAGKKK